MSQVPYYAVHSQLSGHFRSLGVNSVELNHECTSRIFDNAGDNVMLALYNVTLTSQNHASTITSVIAAKQTVINEIYVFFNKISVKRYFIEKYISFIYSAN